MIQRYNEARRELLSSRWELQGMNVRYRVNKAEYRFLVTRNISLGGFPTGVLSGDTPPPEDVQRLVEGINLTGSFLTVMTEYHNNTKYLVDMIKSL